jgi:hypothetical protein
MKSKTKGCNQPPLFGGATGRRVAGVLVEGYDDIPTDVLEAFQGGNVVLGCDQKTGEQALIWGRRLLSLIASGTTAVPVLIQFVPVDLKRHGVERLTKACAAIKGLDWRDELA